jgi:hypothetical protein
MKLNRFLGVILIVGTLILNSCSLQTREVGFGGGNWSIPKRANNAVAKKNTIVDSVISIANFESTEKELNIVQFKNETDQLFAEKTFAKAIKLIPVQKKITKSKVKNSNRSVSSKDIAKSMGWISICFGILATFFSAYKLLSILLAIGGVLLGFVGLKFRPGFLGRILCYAGIAISIFSIFSGIFQTIVTILILVALILLLLIVLKKV